MSLSIFNSSHNHNNAIFNMIHVICPNAKSTNEIFYEIQGNMGTSIESTIKFIENLRTPHIISFFGKKGETYFIRIKYKDVVTGKENKFINFYRYPDDYNVPDLSEDLKVNMEITKKRERQEKNVEEPEEKTNVLDEEVLTNNMVLNFVKNKQREETDESEKEELYEEEEDEEENEDTNEEIERL